MDGIGGTLKRLTARESLQRVGQNQIFTAEQVHTYRQGIISGIVTLLVKKEEMCKVRSRLEHLYNLTSTVPGTPSFHHFVPLTSSIIAAERVSSDEMFSIKYDVIIGRNVNDADLSEIKASEFGMFCYDEEYWINGVLLVDKEQ